MLVKAAPADQANATHSRSCCNRRNQLLTYIHISLDKTPGPKTSHTSTCFHNVSLPNTTMTIYKFSGNCLFNTLFWLTKKKISKTCITVPLWGLSMCVCGRFSSQRDSNADSVFRSWHHYACFASVQFITTSLPCNHNVACKMLFSLLQVICNREQIQSRSE